eukprot:CAMPEP_0205915746 /NCGR_PEP_ID=MMETSP1325-20131115/8071_1 /ASSEMBLY_ACC=CAM_ASM_000708 /TAXON_ID=236786 /ORGANISM="Florenciella sp., Strain RCC1007" /LENGTH=62 /DNA_ID=CAMNT_0053282959 /DNA_START=9 /DNA_END=194 /DNA_ORIENTATION=+
MNVYDDNGETGGLGIVAGIFDRLRVDEKRKMEWFKVWEKIDADMSRTMEYEEFVKYFDLQPD